MVTTRSTQQPTTSTTPSSHGSSAAPTAPSTAPTPSAAPKPPINVLFVCLGNICRSPMAEAVLLHHASAAAASGQRRALGTVDSAGTGAYHAGAAPDRRTAAVLRAHGVAVPARGARVLDAEDWARFDFILAMDAENLADVRAAERRARRREAGFAERARASVALFGDFGGQVGEEVGDPYYGGVDGFERAFEQCERFAKGFLKALEEEEGEEDGEDES